MRPPRLLPALVPANLGTPESARAGYETFLDDQGSSATIEEYQEVWLAEDTKVERLDVNVWTQRACTTRQVDDCFDDLPEAMTDSRLTRCES